MGNKDIVREMEFLYKGFRCVIYFLIAGHRCGYVSIPQGHRYYRKNYDDIPNDVHGGLTYSENFLPGEEFDGSWWVGFDCAQFCDKPDIETFERYIKAGLQEIPDFIPEDMLRTEMKFRAQNPDAEVRDMDFVYNELKDFVDNYLIEEE